jgi:plasmid segregation protein ParM
MVRYIAIDSGKFATKVAEYNAEKECTKKFSLRTKVAEGDFRDDSIEARTVVVEIDGTVYKIGNGARGAGVELETSKKSDVHRLCTLTAIAMLASSNETDEINVAVGLPAKDWASVSKRMDYKDYILPEGEVSISVKKDSSSPVVKKTFVIKNRFVYPESIGALFMDETIGDISFSSITGVLDIGNLNLNATLWQGTELLQDKSTTSELGGAILIQEIAQEISTNITTCDELIVANILKNGLDSLPSDINLSPEQKEECRTLIGRVLREHAEKVKRCCHQRNWSLDMTKIIAIGGTSHDIEAELKEVFGNITILPNSEYCNVLGYLRMMCANFRELGDKPVNITSTALGEGMGNKQMSTKKAG